MRGIPTVGIGVKYAHFSEWLFANTSVADAYQDQGIGSQMGRFVLDCARKIGLKRVILMGGVMAENDIARRVYTKLGFRQLGEFITHQRGEVHNYDMMIEFEGA